MAARANANALQVVVAGGSVAGLAVALSLKQAGCKVTVYERAAQTIAAGAGLALDNTTIGILEGLTSQEAVTQATFPVVDGKLETVIDRVVKEVPKLQDRDTSMVPTRSAQWASIHHLLKSSLPEGMLHYNHTVSSFAAEGEHRLTVSVTDKSHSDTEPKQLEVQADLLVGADGCLTTVGKQLAADEMAMRYAGYCAWRGVLEGDNFPEAAKRLHQLFPGATFHVLQADSSHIIIFKLPGNRFNWIWYKNQPQPKIDKPSPTVQPSAEQVQEMHGWADQLFPGPVAELVKTTEKPFISIIFDREPLQQIVWDRVALVGESAHPSTPHAGRSTNMSIADAHSLGQAVAKHDELPAALKAYQDERLPRTTKEVLFSRYIGLVRQGLIGKGADPKFWHTAKNDTEMRILWQDVRCFDDAAALAKQSGY